MRICHTILIFASLNCFRLTLQVSCFINSIDIVNVLFMNLLNVCLWNSLFRLWIYWTKIKILISKIDFINLYAINFSQLNIFMRIWHTILIFTSLKFFRQALSISDFTIRIHVVNVLFMSFSQISFMRLRSRVKILVFTYKSSFMSPHKWAYTG